MTLPKHNYLPPLTRKRLTLTFFDQAVITDNDHHSLPPPVELAPLKRPRPRHFGQDHPLPPPPSPTPRPRLDQQCPHQAAAAPTRSPSPPSRPRASSSRSSMLLRPWLAVPPRWASRVSIALLLSLCLPKAWEKQRRARALQQNARYNEYERGLTLSQRLTVSSSRPRRRTPRRSLTPP